MRQKALAIIDSELSSEILKRLLAPLAIDLDIASNIEQAKNFLLANKYFCVLFDSTFHFVHVNGEWRDLENLLRKSHHTPLLVAVLCKGQRFNSAIPIDEIVLRENLPQELMRVLKSRI